MVRYFAGELVARMGMTTKEMLAETYYSNVIKVETKKILEDLLAVASDSGRAKKNHELSLWGFSRWLLYKKEN